MFKHIHTAQHSLLDVLVDHSTCNLLYGECNRQQNPLCLFLFHNPKPKVRKYTCTLILHFFFSKQIINILVFIQFSRSQI